MFDFRIGHTTTGEASISIMSNGLAHLFSTDEARIIARTGDDAIYRLPPGDRLALDLAALRDSITHACDLAEQELERKKKST